MEPCQRPRCLVDRSLTAAVEEIVRRGGALEAPRAAPSVRADLSARLLVDSRNAKAALPSARVDSARRSRSRKSPLPSSPMREKSPTARRALTTSAMSVRRRERALLRAATASSCVDRASRLPGASVKVASLGVKAAMTPGVLRRVDLPSARADLARRSRGAQSPLAKAVESARAASVRLPPAASASLYADRASRPRRATSARGARAALQNAKADSLRAAKERGSRGRGFRSAKADTRSVPQRVDSRSVRVDLLRAAKAAALRGRVLRSARADSAASAKAGPRAGGRLVSARVRDRAAGRESAATRTEKRSKMLGSL